MMGTRQISQLHHTVLIQHGTLNLWILCVPELSQTYHKVSAPAMFVVGDDCKMQESVLPQWKLSLQSSSMTTSHN